MIRLKNVPGLLLVSGLVAMMMVGLRAEESALTPYQPLSAPDEASWSDQRLRQFMTDLREYVYEHHAVTDKHRRIYGMVYEFYEDGQQIQAMGLDSMHDGAWFVEALLAAERVHPEGDYLEMAQKYQIPFYTNVANNSDKLFPNMVNKSRQDRTPITKPIKGWVPRGWDDGKGYDRHGNRYGTGTYHNHESSTNVTNDGHFVEAYNMPSNHLAQDLVTMYLKVWLTTRNPAARRAARNVHEYRKNHFREIHSLRRPVQYMDMPEESPETFSSFAPRKGSSARCYFSGLYGQQKQNIRTYSDTLSFAYRRATAHAVLFNKQPVEFMWKLAWNVDAAATVMQLLFDKQSWPPGMWGFHRIRNHSLRGAGTLNRYRSDGRLRLGTRGIQLSWLGAAALPALRNHPEVWEKPYRSDHASDTLVRMVEDAPETDGKRDDVYDQSQSLKHPDTRVTLISDPKHLHLLINSSKPEITVKIRIAEDVTGEKRTGRFTLNEDGTVQARNDAGESLKLDSAFGSGSPWRAELRVPYTVVPGQNQWINGVNHGRYDVQIGSGPWRNVYVLSRPEYIIRRLENLALGTVKNWHQIWKDHGKLPGSVYSINHAPTTHWGQSELGGYAHLIMNMAMILADRAGTSEWTLLKEQFPDEPGTPPELPDPVLEQLGLKK